MEKVVYSNGNYSVYKVGKESLMLWAYKQLLWVNLFVILLPILCLYIRQEPAFWTSTTNTEA